MLFLAACVASGGAVNVFNGETNFGQYLFQGCINLAEVTLSAFPSPRSKSKGSTLQDRTRELAGLPQLYGHPHTCSPKALCSHRNACDVDCLRVLTSVTMIEEIPEFTFSSREVFLPITIRVKAMNCAALVEAIRPLSSILK